MPDSQMRSHLRYKVKQAAPPQEPTMPVVLLLDRLSKSGRSHPLTTMVSLLIRATYSACAS